MCKYGKHAGLLRGHVQNARWHCSVSGHGHVFLTCHVPKLLIHLPGFNVARRLCTQRVRMLAVQKQTSCAPLHQEPHISQIDKRSCISALATPAAVCLLWLLFRACRCCYVHCLLQ
jgi:hypothetical protein